MRRVSTERVPRRRGADRVGPRQRWEGSWEGEGGREAEELRRQFSRSALRMRPDRGPKSPFLPDPSLATGRVRLATFQPCPMDDPLLAAAAPPPPPRPSFAARRRAAAPRPPAGRSRWGRWRRPARRSLPLLTSVDPAPPPPSLRPPDAPSTALGGGVSAAHLTWDAPPLHGRAFVRYAVLTNRSGGGGEPQPDAACAAAALPSCTLAPLGPSGCPRPRGRCLDRRRRQRRARRRARAAAAAMAAPTALAAEYSGADFVCAAWAPPPPAAAPPRYEVQVADATTQVADGDCGAPLNWSAPAPTGEAATASLCHVVGLAAERAYCACARRTTSARRRGRSRSPCAPAATLPAVAAAAPEVVDATADAVELRRRLPADDGGSPGHSTASSCTARATPTAAAWRRARRRRTTCRARWAGWRRRRVRLPRRRATRAGSRRSPQATAHARPPAPGAPGTPSELAGSPLVAWAAAEARGSAVVSIP